MMFWVEVCSSEVGWSCLLSHDLRSPDWGELCAMMWPGWFVPANWGWRMMAGCLRSVDLKLGVQARLHIYVRGGRAHRPATNGRERKVLWGLTVSRQAPRPRPLRQPRPLLAHFYKAALGLLSSLSRLSRLSSRQTNNLSLNLAPPTFPGLYNLPLLIPAKL